MGTPSAHPTGRVLFKLCGYIISNELPMHTFMQTPILLPELTYGVLSIEGVQGRLGAQEIPPGSFQRGALCGGLRFTMAAYCSKDEIVVYTGEFGMLRQD